MPLLFAYGTLQHGSVQLSTFGRHLTGQKDDIVGFERGLVKIEDPAFAASSGKTHHDNVVFNGNDASRVAGTAFEVTDAELLEADGYEIVFSYKRVTATLASGRQAWVYVHAAAGGGG